MAEERDDLQVREVESLMEDYLLDCQYRLLSKATIETRRVFLRNLLWFLRDRHANECSPRQIKQFFVYLANGHLEERGRWGNPRLRQAARPVTIKDYHIALRIFFDWAVSEEMLSRSPMEGIPKPQVRTEQVQPFSPEQIEALVEAAKVSLYPLRNELIVLLLLDTGMRASELCGLRTADVDLLGRRCVVLGKGNKHRTIYFGRRTGRLLGQYLRQEKRGEKDCVFLTDRGTTSGEALKRNGLRQLIQRLGAQARIKATRCSPHTFRHTFAVEFLRAGGNTFSLKELLGHTTLAMTNNYVALAQADLAAQHRQFSPADQIMTRRKKDD